MKDHEKTREQLVGELEEMRRRTAALETSKTELEQTVAGLRETVERLNLALKSSQTGTWSWNLLTGTVIWDDYIHPLCGLKPGTFLESHQHFLDLLHPDDRQRVECEVARCLEEIAGYDTEYRVIWPDGSVHVIASQSKVYADQRGRATRMTGVCWDVTERNRAQEALRETHNELEQRVRQRTDELATANAVLKKQNADRQKAEEGLRKSEEEYRTLVETIPHGIQEIDTSGMITFCNAAYHKMLGYEREEVLGKYIWDLLAHDLEKDQLRPYLKELVESQPPCTPYFQTNLTKHGKPIHVQVDWNYKRNETGAVAGFISVITDVTERKKAEEKLESEGRLLRKMLDLQERERKLVAHEIHDGFVQDVVSAKMTLEGALRELKSQNRSGADRFQPVGDLLARAIAEGRRMIAELRPMIIDEEGVVAAMEHLIAKEYFDPALQVKLSSSANFDRLDSMLEGAIFRIVQEALTNVRRHSQCNSATVELTRDNRRLLLEIRDHGVGFDPSLVSDERFGLRGIRERARLLGGHATIDSAPGNGTRITVELPLKGERSRTEPNTGHISHPMAARHVTEPPQTLG